MTSSRCPTKVAVAEGHLGDELPRTKGRVEAPRVEAREALGKAPLVLPRPDDDDRVGVLSLRGRDAAQVVLRGWFGQSYERTSRVAAGVVRAELRAHFACGSWCEFLFLFKEADAVL